MPSDPMLELIAHAAGLAGVTESIACAGTAVEKRSFKAKNKSFLFLGSSASSYDAMLKLGPSLDEARALAQAEPGRYKVGAHGWVTATLPHDAQLPEHLRRWLDESYRLVVPRPKD